jgi:hypothetical protein
MSSSISPGTSAPISSTLSRRCDAPAAACAASRAVSASAFVSSARNKYPRSRNHARGAWVDVRIRSSNSRQSATLCCTIRTQTLEPNCWRMPPMARSDEARA